MTIAFAAMRLANDARADLDEIEVEASAATGSMHLCIPEEIALKLQLKDSGVREVTLGDGHVRQIRYVSPVRIKMGNRVCVTGALVLGNQVLLGAIPMEDMDLIVDSVRHEVIVNPCHPNAPRAFA